MENSPATQKATVFLVEDHDIVLQGLTLLIDGQPDLAVCGSSATIKDTLPLVRKLKPDVVIVDISLADGSGLELIKQIHEVLPDLPILALSMHDENLFAERAMRAGAKGYVMKKEATKTVMTAIRKVLSGEMHVSTGISSKLLMKLMHPDGAKQATPLEMLSDREFEVFSMIARGLGPTEIAHQLKLSVKTVQAHRENIKDKLNLQTGAELTRYALQWAMQQS